MERASAALAASAAQAASAVSSIGAALAALAEAGAHASADAAKLGYEVRAVPALRKARPAARSTCAAPAPHLRRTCAAPAPHLRRTSPTGYGHEVHAVRYAVHMR